MSLTQFEPYNQILEKILDAPLGEVVTVLGDNLRCRVYLDVIEQTTPKPGTKFERKITVSAEGLPLIRATIKFDRKELPSYIVKELLQKSEKIGTILKNYGISNKKNTVFLTRGKNSLFRVYQVKHNNRIWFEISEEIKLNHLDSILREFPLGI